MRLKLFVLLFAVFVPLACSRAEVRISEVGPSNHCTYFDESGETPDWIELKNEGDEKVSLDGWAITDSQSLKPVLSLTGHAIPPDGYLMIPIPSDAGFHLSASGETVYLLKDNEIRQTLSCPAIPQDAAYAWIDDDYRISYLPTPGMKNLYLEENTAFVRQSGVRLNEIITSAAPYKDTEGYDYVELFNSGKNARLKGWELRLGMAGAKTFSLPDKTLEKGKYQVIYCTDEETKKTHAGFHLPAQGALISLWNADGTLMDFIRLPEQYPNVSYGVSSDGTATGYLTSKTPGKKNGTAYAWRAEKPVFSLMGGVFEQDAITVEIKAAPTTQIRYTIDGAMPTKKSKLYTDPITMEKTTALRTVAFAEEAMPSEAASATYVLGLDAAFPVISLIIDPYYISDEQDGAFLGMTGNTHNYRLDWEYPASFEYFDASGNTMINQACGFGVQGDSSRGQKQKGIQLVARKSYGTADRFYFNPFENRDFDSYKSFNLRAAGSEGPINVRFRDAALSSLAEGTHMLYAAAQPVLVYLNGRVYGHYNLRERINKYFIAQHEGVEGDAVDQIDILSETGDWVRNGSGKDYKALSTFMKNHDLNDPENLNYVLSQMDVNSYFEYVAFMLATGNKDLSNSRFYRVPGGKWKWALYDLDRGLEAADNIAAFWLYTLPINHDLELLTDHVPFAALMKVPEMREQFLSALGKIMATRFTTANLIALINDWHDRVVDIMPYQLETWTQDDMHYWEALVERMRDCARKRPNLVIQYTQQYFKLTEEEMQRYFGNFLKLQKE